MDVIKGKGFVAEKEILWIFEWFHGMMNLDSGDSTVEPFLFIKLFFLTGSVRICPED